MYGPHIGEFQQTITVSGGVGAGTFVATGKIWDVYIVPNQPSTFDWTLADGLSVPRGGQTGVTVTTLFDLGGRPCSGTNTISILNATNGTYTVTVNVELGH